jgi:hypothetical protein
MLRRHSFVMIVATINLLELLFKLQKLWITLERSNHESHRKSVLNTILTIYCLLALIVIIFFQGFQESCLCGEQRNILEMIIDDRILWNFLPSPLEQIETLKSR